MKPNQPEKENVQPDEYFRQYADHIPIAFNPAHWEQLATALDQAANPGRQVKGAYFGRKWWLPGIFLVLLSTGWGIWQATAVSEVKNRGNGRAIPVDSTYSTKSDPEASQPVLTNKRLSQKPAAPLPNLSTLPVETLHSADTHRAPADSMVLQQLPPGDSLKVPPLKKKKNLFW